MPVPQDRKYLETHEWHQLAGDVVTIGITQNAADELTDITYVKLPTVGTKVTAGSPWGEIESVKATSDLYTGVSGTVTRGQRRAQCESGTGQFRSAGQGMDDQGEGNQCGCGNGETAVGG